MTASGGREYSASLIQSRVVNRLRGDPGHEDRDGESDDGAGDGDDGLRRVLGGQFRTGGAEPDEGDGGGEDADDGGGEIAGEADAGGGERVIHEEEREDG